MKRERFVEVVRVVKVRDGRAHGHGHGRSSGWGDPTLGREEGSRGNGDTVRREALKRADSAVCGASDFMQPWPGAVENGVGVGQQ